MDKMTKFTVFTRTFYSKKKALQRSISLKKSLGNVPSKFYNVVYLPMASKNDLIIFGEVFFLGMDLGSTYCAVFLRVIKK